MVSSTGGIATDSNGLYVDTTDDFVWSGTNTFSATTTVNGPFTVSATSTLATTTISDLTVDSLMIGVTSTLPLVDGSSTTLHYHPVSFASSSSNLVITSIPNADAPYNAGMVKVKEITVYREGTMRVDWDHIDGTGAGCGSTTGLYLNASSTVQYAGSNGGATVTRSSILTVKVNDKIQIYEICLKRTVKGKYS